jgi:hypothetical protein
LRDTPGLYAQLSTRLVLRDDRAGSRHTKVSGSPALINLSALALLDPRTEPGDPCDQACTIDHEHDDGLLAVAATIQGWALILVEMRGLRSPIDTLERAVNLLIAWWDTITAALWIDELYSDVQQIHSALWRITDQEQPVGRCWGWDPQRPCGGPLYPNDQGDIQCARPECGRKYVGLQATEVRIQTEREAS